MAFCNVCGEEYSDARAALGYRTCLEHGESKRDFIVVPVSKSNYVVGTMNDLKHSYNSKGQR